MDDEKVVAIFFSPMSADSRFPFLRPHIQKKPSIDRRYQIIDIDTGDLHTAAL